MHTPKDIAHPVHC